MRAARWIGPLAAALLVVGCGDDPTIVNRSDTPDDPDGYLVATTEDVLITNFLRAYNERNYEEYEAMLHADFLFYLSQEDVNAGADLRFDRARDLEATYNMFKGKPGQTPDGEVQPPIRSINLRLTPEGPDWTDQFAQDFLGTTMRRYQVDMTVEFIGSPPSAVVGLQEFYAIAVPHDDGDGTVTTTYQLKFWRDLGTEGLKSGTSDSSWGRVKSMY